MSVLTTATNKHTSLKPNIVTPKGYESIITVYIGQLDKWIETHKEKLNTPHARLTHLGVVDVYLKNEKGKLELDFARTMLYFGRWENATLFKGIAIAGIEIGMLWVVDTLLDLWHKYVNNKDGKLDAVIEELFDFRRDLVTLMERYTLISLDKRQAYQLPAKDRRKPSSLYNIEVHDAHGEYGGVIFDRDKQTYDMWTDSDKSKLAEELAIGVGVEWMGASIPYYNSEAHMKQRIEEIQSSRRILNDPAVKAALKQLNDDFTKRLNDLAFNNPPAAKKLADEAVQQEVMYTEMKRRVKTLENERREVLKSEGCSNSEDYMNRLKASLKKQVEEAMLTPPLGSDLKVTQHDSLIEELKGFSEQDLDNLAALAKKERDYWYEKHLTYGWKLQALEREAKIKLLKNKCDGTVVYTGDEGKTQYTVTPLAKTEEAAIKKLNDGGPPKRDLVLDSPHELITMNIYQEYALLTANQDMSKSLQLVNAILGLEGEAGEVSDLLKKRWFHPWSNVHHTKMSGDQFKAMLLDEIGDVQWYLAWIAKLCDATLGQVAKNNRRKLVDRHGKGSLNANK